MSSSTLAELARLVEGTLHGDGNLPITGATTLASATANDVSFAESNGFHKQIAESAAAAVVVPRETEVNDRPYIEVDDARSAFVKIVEQFRPQRKRARKRVDSTAKISPSARVADDVSIATGVVIGDDVCIGPGSVIHPNVVISAGCQLAEDVEVFPNVVLYEDTIVGARCILHAGCIIGAYGFGYDTNRGKHHLSPQLGYVVLEDDVEVGACSTIDRGTYAATLIGEGTKIDNQVQIAHNCQIGRHNLLCAQVGIAGSSTTGDYVVMAGQVGVPDHVSIGDRVILGAKAGVMKSVPSDVTMLGIPATPEREQLTKHALLGKLPEMRKQLRALQKEVQQLKMPKFHPKSDAA